MLKADGSATQALHRANNVTETIANTSLDASHLGMPLLLSSCPGSQSMCLATRLLRTAASAGAYSCRIQFNVAGLYFIQWSLQ